MKSKKLPYTEQEKIVGGSQGSGFIEEGRMENIKSLNEKN